jgi:hypothetical protein
MQTSKFTYLSMLVMSNPVMQTDVGFASTADHPNR